MSNLPVIRVIGVGGAGNNTVGRIVDYNLKGVDIFAVNTDARVLLKSKAPKKVLVGKDITEGISTGNNIKLGERCARYDISRLSTIVEGSDLMFILCGLGGGTGSGVSPVIAELSKANGALTIAIVTLPFDSEGDICKSNAQSGLANLRKNSDAVILIPNSKFLKLNPDIPLIQSFRIIDDMVAKIIKELVRVIGDDGTVNLSIADLRCILRDGRTAVMAIGSGSTAEDSLKDALKSPFINFKLAEVDGIFVNIIGDENLELESAEKIVRLLAEKTENHAEIIWGVQANEIQDDTAIKTVLIVSKD